MLDKILKRIEENIRGLVLVSEKLSYRITKLEEELKDLKKCCQHCECECSDCVDTSKRPTDWKPV